MEVSIYCVMYDLQMVPHEVILAYFEIGALYEHSMCIGTEQI